MTWTLLSAADDARRPSARFWHGFTSAGGRLYVHGGYGYFSDYVHGDSGDDASECRRAWCKEMTSLTTVDLSMVRECRWVLG